MNRRDVISGLAVSPVAAGSAAIVAGDAAYGGQRFQCGVCKGVMFQEFRADQAVAWCPQDHCERFEVAYLVPMVILERA